MYIMDGTKLAGRGQGMDRERSLDQTSYYIYRNRHTSYTRHTGEHIGENELTQTNRQDKERNRNTILIGVPYLLGLCNDTGAQPRKSVLGEPLTPPSSLPSLPIPHTAILGLRPPFLLLLSVSRGNLWTMTSYVPAGFIL